MLSDLHGCFRALSCEDISEFEDNPNLSAARCDTGNFVSFCSCCEHAQRFGSGGLPRDCETAKERCAGSTPAPLPGPTPDIPPTPSPSPSGGGSTPGGPVTTSVLSAPAGCLMLNTFRNPDSQIECSAAQEEQAVKLLRELLESDIACNAASFARAMPANERSHVALLAGPDVSSCSWDGSMGAWLKGGSVSKPWQQAGSVWEDLPTPRYPGALFFGAGTAFGGCAEGRKYMSVSGDDALSFTCDARLCFLDPPLTVPSFVEPSRASPPCYNTCGGGGSVCALGGDE